MLRRAHHSRVTRHDPTLEPELFPADEIPATTLSSPLSSSEEFAPAPSSVCLTFPTPETDVEHPAAKAEPSLTDASVTEQPATETADAEAEPMPIAAADAEQPAPEADPTPADDLEPLFTRLARSEFRSHFRLRTAERAYIERKGLPTLRRHAEEFVRTRLAPALPPNDGRQTPMRGHPVFIAQHAAGCCCRGCLSKWHGIPAGSPLTEAEQHYIVRVLLTWIMRQLGR